MIADDLTVGTIRSLVYGPKTLDEVATELETSIERLRDKARQMLGDELIRPVRRDEESDGSDSEALLGALEVTRHGRTLAFIRYLAMRVEWTLRGGHGPPGEYTLLDILDLLVPGARVRGSVDASCVLVELYADGSWPIRARLRLHAGTLAVEPVGADDDVRVHASGEPGAWDEALGTQDPDRLTVIGDSDLLYEVLRALMAH